MQQNFYHAGSNTGDPGLSIDTKNRVEGFYEDKEGHPLKIIDEEFQKQGIEITPGSFFTAKAENLRRKDKGKGYNDYWMDLTVTLYLSSGYGKKKKLIYVPSISIKDFKNSKSIIFYQDMYRLIN